MTSFLSEPTGARAARARIGTSPAGEAARGFTLIELLVVLFVIALLVAISPPLLNRALPGLQLKAAAQETAAAFREARTAAIRENREVPVVIDLDDRTVRVGVDGTATALPRDIGIGLRTAASELIDQGSGGIRFYPDGTSTGGRVRLSFEERAQEVVVDWLTGRVRIED